MGASFRNSGEILELAGCDLLTISPNLMEELRGSEDEVFRHLDAAKAKTMDIETIDMDESTFRWMMNEDGTHGYVNIGSECILDCSGISNSEVNVYNNSCICKLGFTETRSDGDL